MYNSASSNMSIELVSINQLERNPQYPIRTSKNCDLKDLTESVKSKSNETTTGILTPLSVRKHENGMYQIIDGHNRYEVTKELGIEAVPCNVMELDESEAYILMVDGLLRNRELRISEKARAFKLKHETLTHQGKRIGDSQKKTAETIGDMNGVSGRTIQRYIKLLNLTDGWLDELDENKISLALASRIANIRELEQGLILELRKENKAINLNKVNKIEQEIKDRNKSGKTPLTKEEINEILKQEEKANKAVEQDNSATTSSNTQVQSVTTSQVTDNMVIHMPKETIRKYFNVDKCSDSEVQKLLEDALAFYSAQHSQETTQNAS